MDQPRWLDWAIELSAIAQNGLTFSENTYDRERYQRIRELSAEIMARGSDSPYERVLDLLSHDTGYTTPKVDVRGVAFREGKILLVKELADGMWTLPGGWADPLESAAESVVREVREESGFESRATKVLAIYDRSKHPHTPLFPHHVYKIFVRCELTGGAPADSSETSSATFFAENEIPPLSRTRVTEFQIARMFEHFRNPDLPTEFD
jgi:ADP-ribose pyrophosphatase YjhB (NUDIX family)